MSILNDATLHNLLLSIKKEFYLPAVFIEQCHLFSCEIKVISQKDESSLGFVIIKLNPTQFLRVLFGNIKPCQFADLIIFNTRGLINFSRVHSLKFQIGFSCTTKKAE